MPTITLSQAGDALILVVGAAGLSSQISVPLSNLQAFDLVAQAGVVAAGVASNVNPAFAFPAFLISEVAAITGTALVTIYEPEAEQALSSGSLTLPTELEYAGEAVAVLGDLFGILSAASTVFALPTLKIAASVGSIIFTTAGAAITGLQVGPIVLNVLKSTITHTINGTTSALSSSEATAAAVVGSAWTQTEGALTAALAEVSNLFAAISANNSQNFVSEFSAVSNAISKASSALLGEFGVQAATGPNFTESGSNGTTTVVNGQVTATGQITSVSNGISSSASVSGSDPFILSDANDISQNGTTMLAYSGDSGSVTTSETVYVAGDAPTFSDIIYNDVTIQTSTSDPSEINVAADDSTYVDVTGPVPADDVQIKTLSDDSEQVLLGGDGGIGATQLVTYASGSLSGDTLSIGYNSGTVDVTTDISSGDDAMVAVDVAVVGVSQDFDFAGSTGTLLLDSPTTFTGTISNFEAGDTIDLAGVAGVQGATFSGDNVLTLQETGGGNITLNLDPTGNYDSESLLLIPDGNGGTEVIAESNSSTISFLGTSDVLVVVDPASLTGTITNFQRGDTIDLAGIVATGAMLSDDDVLTVQDSGGGSVALNLDPTGNYGSDNFLFTPDGLGGTEITEHSDLGIMGFTGPNEELLIVNSGSISFAYSDVYVSNVQSSDTVDFAGISGSSVSFSYDTNYTGIPLTQPVVNAKGSLPLEFFMAAGATDPVLTAVPDGNGGTDVVAGTAISGDYAPSDLAIVANVPPIYQYPPGANNSSSEYPIPYSVNDSGELAGSFGSAGSTGFLESSGSYTVVIPPYYPLNVYENSFILTISIAGVSDSGEVAGSFTYYDSNGAPGESGFIYSNGVYTEINYPSITTPVYGQNSATNIIAISSDGTILGSYRPEAQSETIYTYFTESGGLFTNITGLPTGTIPVALSDSGLILTSTGAIYNPKNGSNTPLPFTIAGATSIKATGINDSGEIVGYFTGLGGAHGFVYDAGSVSIVDVPGAVSVTSTGRIGGTYLTGINDEGEVVGYFSTSSTTQGFTADLEPGTVSCFAGGTLIRTRRGEVPVEVLASGEVITTEFEGTAAVKWIGHRRVDCRRHPKPKDVWPVRIRPEAFGSGIPNSDLWLSPDHAVFINGVLIAIRQLVNGATIVQEPRDEVTYWHVELEHHDVIRPRVCLVRAFSIPATARHSIIPALSFNCTPTSPRAAWKAVHQAAARHF